tara:strand:- start:47 stop:481 length:435 start_codon:yes stop_codon:yes gene_type:complete
MKLDSKGFSDLHEREGLSLLPYLDTKGIPTIAMGNTFYTDGTKVTMKDKKLTILQANILADQVAASFAAEVDKMIKSKVNQNQFNNLVSIAYNIGLNGFRTSTFLKLVNVDPNDHNIASAILMWVKDKELIGRRCNEAIGYFSN